MDIRTIKMFKDQKGAPYGVLVRSYYNNETYDLPEELSRTFVEELRVAEYVDVLSETKLKQASETAIKIELDTKAKAVKKQVS